jgi:biofilm protein TabA
MIIDTIDNGLSLLPENLKRALSMLQNKDVLASSDGKHTVDGDNLFYITAHYSTKPIEQCKFEAHRKYIDIQCILKGEEIIGYANVNELKVSEKYSDDKDIEFYQPYEGMSKLVLKQGTFCVFYPHDAHMPCCQTTKQSEIHKIVFKVRV